MNIFYLKNHNNLYDLHSSKCILNIISKIVPIERES